MLSGKRAARVALLSSLLLASSAPFAQRDSVPDFSATDLQGVEQNLSKLKGQISIVTLWATWCFPCRYEMPLLESLYRKLKGRGLKVIAIAVDDDLNAVRAYQAEKGFSFPILFDGTGASKRAFGVKGVPATYVVTQDQRLVPVTDSSTGKTSVLVDNPMVWQQPETLKLLEDLLNAKAAGA